MNEIHRLNGIRRDTAEMSTHNPVRAGELRPAIEMDDHSISREKLFERYGIDLAVGLTTKKHAELINDYGMNQFTPPARSGLSRIFPCLFAPPRDLNAPLIPEVIIMIFLLLVIFLINRQPTLTSNIFFYYC